MNRRTQTKAQLAYRLRQAVARENRAREEYDDARSRVRDLEYEIVSRWPPPQPEEGSPSWQMHEAYLDAFVRIGASSPVVEIFEL